MPNYFKTSNGKYNPFTFDEMVKPLTMYKEEFEKNQAQAADLADKAGAWENLANSAKDISTYNMYKKYANDLRQVANNMVQYGLTPSTKQDVLNMKTRYSNEIVPIQNAWVTRKAQIEAQAKMRAADPSREFSYDANDLGLDTYVADPAKMYQEESLDRLYGQAKEIYKQFARDPRSVGPWLEKIKNEYGTELFQQMFRLGYTGKEVVNNPFFRKFVEDEIMKSSEISNWGSDDQKKKARAAINKAIPFAIGSVNTKEYNSNAWQMNARASAEKKKTREMFKPAAVPVAIPNSEDLAGEAKDLVKKIKSHYESGFIDEDGSPDSVAIINDIDKKNKEIEELARSVDPVYSIAYSALIKDQDDYIKRVNSDINEWNEFRKIHPQYSNMSLKESVDNFNADDWKNNLYTQVYDLGFGVENTKDVYEQLMNGIYDPTNDTFNGIQKITYPKGVRTLDNQSSYKFDRTGPGDFAGDFGLKKDGSSIKADGKKAVKLYFDVQGDNADIILVTDNAHYRIDPAKVRNLDGNNELIGYIRLLRDYQQQGDKEGVDGCLSKIMEILSTKLAAEQKSKVSYSTITGKITGE